MRQYESTGQIASKYFQHAQPEFYKTMHSKNVDSRLGGYDTMLISIYQQEFTTSSLGLMDPEDGGSKAPPKHPLPNYLLTQYHIPTHFKFSTATLKTSCLT